MAFWNGTVGRLGACCFHWRCAGRGVQRDKSCGSSACNLKFQSPGKKDEGGENRAMWHTRSSKKSANNQTNKYLFLESFEANAALLSLNYGALQASAFCFCQMTILHAKSTGRNLEGGNQEAVGSGWCIHATQH